MPKPDMQMPDLLTVSVLMKDFCAYSIGMCRPWGQVKADEESLSRATVLKTPDGIEIRKSPQLMQAYMDAIQHLDSNWALEQTRGYKN